MQDDAPQIFISYANADQQRVIPFFDELEKHGFNVWLDCKKIKPGQNWDFEIKRALDKSSLVIAFLSETSVSRRGYVQRELRTALNKLYEKLEDDIYIIPIILDEGLKVPEQLKGIQHISANSPDCLLRVQDALTDQLGRLGLEVQRIQHREEVSWSFNKIKEEWDGLPGYEIELQLVQFQSPKYPKLGDVGDYVKGNMLKSLFSARANKLNQNSSIFNYGQDKYRRTNTFDAQCGEPSIVGKVLTIEYVIRWYGAGAAHDNINFATYSFVMDPLHLIEELSSIFSSTDKAFAAIQANVRQTLKATKIGDGDGFALDPQWIDKGTQDWRDFACFVPKEKGIEFLFAPYHVSAYACGPQSALMPYTELVSFMREEYLSAFGIEHVAYRKRNLQDG